MAEGTWRRANKAKAERRRRLSVDDSPHNAITVIALPKLQKLARYFGNVDTAPAK